MSQAKFFISLVLAISLLVGQAGIVFAAPASQQSAPVAGTIYSITLETDRSTGITIVTVEVADPNQVMQTVRITPGTASALGLVALNGDGHPVINLPALGKPIEIDPKTIIPQEQDRHPLGNVLATYFSDITDYETIMASHQEGLSFGVITQALWLTKQLRGNADVFTALLVARQTGDYSVFALEDGTTPKNWGQLRKAILDGKRVNKAASHPDSGNHQNNGNKQDQDKDKRKHKNK